MSYGFSKVSPSNSECQRCINISKNYNSLPDCNNCSKKQIVEVLQFIKSFWESTAICKTKEGRFVEIPINRLEKVDPIQTTSF